MIIFSLLGCTTHLINGILWADGLEDIAPVWCDISTKINIGLSVGLPLASLSINRRLCHNANSFTASSMSSRRRDMIIDTVVCVGGTLVFMAVHYTQQGHRYNILERFGCWPTTYLTELGWAFVVAPPILISLISCGYCLFAISGFMKRRQEFNEHFQKGCDDNHAINYIRLMLLSMCELTFGLPCTVFFFVAAFVASVKRKTIYHWISWEDTHFNFSRVERITLYMSRQGGAFVVPSYDISRFAFPITALMFFVFFGFSSQAYQSYYEAYAWIAFKVFGKSLPRWNDRGQGSRNRSVFKLPLSVFLVLTKSPVSLIAAAGLITQLPSFTRMSTPLRKIWKRPSASQIMCWTASTTRRDFPDVTLTVSQSSAMHPGSLKVPMPRLSSAMRCKTLAARQLQPVSI
ncbi:pheromone A receptor-domain-containing protein [Auriculariales sp. MPI-PUGE-AT-0066]|nr:pheromone A receptor-domain-containing protein [Auriculariales sp. MPI-PUGE-AT-0066]